MVLCGWLSLLLLVVACTAAPQQQYTCNYNLTNLNFTATGFSLGTLKFDWILKAMSFVSSSTSQQYQFNAQGGYFGQTAGQYFFSYSPSCPCRTSAYRQAQPCLVRDTTYLVPTGLPNVYKPKTNESTLATVTFTTAGDFPTAATFTDGRSFTFSGCAASSFTAASWADPSGCYCGAPQDVVIALERSQFVSLDLFNAEKKFATDLVNSFVFGPVDTNLGIVNFNALSWSGPVMLNNGVTQPFASGGAAGLACAPNPQCHVAGGFTVSASTCCGSGSCVSCGMVQGTDMLANYAVTTPARINAAKVLIVVTTGQVNALCPKTGENPNYDGSGNVAPATVTTALPSASAITDELNWAVDYAKRRIPTIEIYAVGTSGASAVLTTIAGNNASRVFAISSESDLLKAVASLTVRTCSTPLTAPCESCCGTCACSDWCRQNQALGVGTCVDGNGTPHDGCDPTCRVEPGWTCTSTSTTTTTCKPTCGDGMVVGIEQCDDHNVVSGDGCSSTCTMETGWRCPSAGLPCLPICGDGLVLGIEKCDDKNLVNGDGCSATCQVEVGYACPTPGAPCLPVCGNGLVNGTELCDDGNKLNGDGCSSVCTVEIGWTCETPNTPCIDINECTRFGCPDLHNLDVRYVPLCFESNNKTYVPRVPLNQRVCTCENGFVVNGTDATTTRLIHSVSLVAAAKFPGCIKEPMCTLYGCNQIATYNGLAAYCTDSTNGPVSLLYRRCTCGVAGWYTVQSGVQYNEIELYNDTGFAGCTSRCGDAIVVGNEQCDDGNTNNGDGCSSTCQVESGYTCGAPGLLCCPSLESAVLSVFKAVCWDGWWVPYGSTKRSSTPTITLSGDAQLSQNLLLCGFFNLDVNLIISENMTLTIAGTMSIQKGGNLTFLSTDPSSHGIVQLIDTCGLPSLNMDYTQPQLSMDTGSVLSISGFDWPKLYSMTYQQYIDVLFCSNTTKGAIYMWNAVNIPSGSNSFPVVSTTCGVGQVGPTDYPWSTVTPVDLPDHCSDMLSFYLENKENGLDSFLQLNKKALCNADIYTISTVIPFVLAALLVCLLLACTGAAVSGGSSADSYHAL